eukprot:284327-Pelagomonas_calceolata.AAC.1
MSRQPGRASSRKEKKNYVGEETLPTSVEQKETHWLKRAVRKGKERVTKLYLPAGGSLAEAELCL